MLCYPGRIILSARSVCHKLHILNLRCPLQSKKPLPTIKEEKSYSYRDNYSGHHWHDIKSPIVPWNTAKKVNLEVHKQCSYPDPKYEEEEPSVVIHPNTVVDPGAVVVHVHDALLTQRAVMASDWFWKSFGVHVVVFIFYWPNTFLASNVPLIYQSLIFCVSVFEKHA